MAMAFNRGCHSRTRPRAGRAFTMIELMVIIALIAALLAMLLPGLSRARGAAKSVGCASNIRQVCLANRMYADDNDSRFCPGAADFLYNLNRWHGTRTKITEPFTAARGPLIDYLGEDRAIRACPEFSEFLAKTGAAFEMGCGGYGYNNAFVGVQLAASGGGFFVVQDDRTGVMQERVRHPAATIMMTDTAFATTDLVEYSFVEPRFFPQNGYRPDPSIHFRHGAKRGSPGTANVGWVDGHVDAQRRTFTSSSGMYPADAGVLNLGWFGESDDNSLFDLE